MEKERLLQLISNLDEEIQIKNIEAENFANKWDIIGNQFSEVDLNLDKFDDPITKSSFSITDPQEESSNSQPQEPQDIQDIQEPQDPQEPHDPQDPQDPHDPQELQDPQDPQDLQYPQEFQEESTNHQPSISRKRRIAAPFIS